MATFQLDANEAAKFKAWQNEHDKTCPHLHRQGAIGGRTTFSFTDTTLGRVAQVSCSCGGRVDLTDYDSW